MIDLLCWLVPLGISLLIAFGTGLAAIYFMIAKAEPEDRKQKRESRDYKLDDQKEVE